MAYSARSDKDRRIRERRGKKVEPASAPIAVNKEGPTLRVPTFRASDEVEFPAELRHPVTSQADMDRQIELLLSAPGPTLALDPPRTPRSMDEAELATVEQLALARDLPSAAGASPPPQAMASLPIDRGRGPAVPSPRVGDAIMARVGPPAAEAATSRRIDPMGFEATMRHGLTPEQQRAADTVVRNQLPLFRAGLPNPATLPIGPHPAGPRPHLPPEPPGPGSTMGVVAGRAGAPPPPKPDYDLLAEVWAMMLAPR